MTHYEQSLEWATESLRTKGSYLEIEDEEQNTWGYIVLNLKIIRYLLAFPKKAGMPL
jgi:hypothetical protein